VSGLTSNPKTLTIVGLGLLGASLAEAARKRHPDWKIIGVSADKTIRDAKAAKVIDEGFVYQDVRTALKDCDFGFICLPIDRILGLLAEWAGLPLELKPGAILSDVGSTKAEICAAARKAFPADSANAGAFIGSHPMAGSEKTGLAARDAHLFETAAWIVCPDKAADLARVELLEHFIEELGARVLRFAPERHDVMVAEVSHLPQLVATALAAHVSSVDNPDETLQVAGAGFRDMTRLAASSFAVWEPILRTNRRNLEVILPAFRRELEMLEEDLVEDGGGRFFAEANALRAKYQAPRKGFTSKVTEILVDIEDKAGALLNVLKPLSDAGLNILDLEILKVREGEEGVLMMGFRKPFEAEMALTLLASSGHKARLR
jgi:prephenate dehydrogenase